MAEIRDQREHIVDQILDGADSPIIDVFDEAQYKESKELRDKSQRLNELSFHPGYKELFRIALNNADLYVRLQRQYRGVDAAEKETRLQNQRVADGIVEFLRANVEDAVNTPRPVLHPQQQ